jgi:hypothetical protein
MKFKRNLISILAALFLALLCTVPVMAQEATATPTVTVPDASITLNIWQVIGGVIAAVSVGGIAGFAGAGVLASRLKNDAATMKAIEALADSAPRHVIEALAAIGRSSIGVGELLVEATDGVPAGTKARVTVEKNE